MMLEYASHSAWLAMYASLLNRGARSLQAAAFKAQLAAHAVEIFKGSQPLCALHVQACCATAGTAPLGAEHSGEIGLGVNSYVGFLKLGGVEPDAHLRGQGAPGFIQNLARIVVGLQPRQRQPEIHMLYRLVPMTQYISSSYSNGVLCKAQGKALSCLEEASCRRL